MNLNQVTLPATDVVRSAAFYRRMGFRQIVENLPGYARFECPEGTATFSLHQVDAVAADSGVVIYFECADLDATVAALRANGFAIDSDPVDQPWLWREAYLRDPDGNTICLFHAGKHRRYPPWRLAETKAAPGRYVIEVEDDPDGDDYRVLAEGLTQHALPIVGKPGFQPVGVFARSDDGIVVGGIAAMINWQWLSINLVWVEESLRGTGLGHELLMRIEDVGRRHGCTRAHLDTFSYQARPFYERHGYVVFATLDEYPAGHKRFFLRKDLA
jgi:catechol 2,3-dioxygenase-like lactoylglutathione lyase family enzyme